MKIVSLFFHSKDVFSFVDQIFTYHFLYIFLKYFAIPFFAILILYFIGLLVLSRFFLDKLADKKSALEEVINDFLTDLIFSNYPFEEIKAKIETYKKSEQFQHKWCKYLILNKLIHIRQNIKDVNHNLILIIYIQFGLHKYSQQLINRRKWYYKSLGFFHYQSLEYKVKKTLIKPYLKSRNKCLKSNALIALIALSDEKFDILNNYADKIPSADEMKILDLIYQKKSIIPETVYNWIDSSNSSIVVLGIKVIVRYREPLSIAKIDYLLLHQDKSVRKETVLAIRELLITEASGVLMQHFKKEPDFRNKISILKTLGVVGNMKIKDFLIKLLSEENNIDLKFEIVSCLNKIDKSFFNDFEIKDEQDKKIISKMVLHVNNPYL